MLPAPGTIIVRACTLKKKHYDQGGSQTNAMIRVLHQSFVPKMRARVGERAVPMVQNTIARKIAGFL